MWILHVVRNQILRFNDFEPSDYNEEEASQLVQDVIADSEKLHAYSSYKVDHTNPNLVKYFYLFCNGLVRSKEDKETSETGTYKDQHMKNFKALPPVPKVTIKIEISQNKRDLKQKIEVLKSGKKQLTMIAEEIKDLQAIIQNKMLLGASNTDQLTDAECDKKLEILVKFGDEIRGKMKDYENKSMSEEDAETNLKDVKSKAINLLHPLLLLCVLLFICMCF